MKIKMNEWEKHEIMLLINHDIYVSTLNCSINWNDYDYERITDHQHSNILILIISYSTIVKGKDKDKNEVSTHT